MWAGFLTLSGHGPCEALSVDYGELRLGHRPLTRRHLPLLLGPVQDKKEELHCRVVAREMAAGADSPAKLGVQCFDSVRRVDDFANFLGEGEERDDLGPGPAPALADGFVFLTPFTLLERRQGLLGSPGIARPIDLLQRGRDGLAVFVGGEVEAVAQEVDDAGL